MLTETFLNELKMRNDIEDVVGSYVDLKRAGGSNQKGLCPFHGEKTPSFMVYKQTQSFYCFGCGAGGDVITFIKKIENLDYMESIKLLAQRSGMQMPEQGVDDSQSKLKLRILAANREAAKFFHSQLNTQVGEQARGYLKNRGLLDKSIVRFGLGYAPDSWDSLLNHLRGLGFGLAELEAAALIVPRSKGSGHYDKFRNRIMFPIIDLRGNVIAFGGRALGKEDKPKYINTDITPVYHKSRYLYALNLAKQSKRGELILCEGYMDVIAMHQAGFDNAVAGLGTAIGEAQAKLISNYVQRVVLAYDADVAGQTATKRAIDILQPVGLSVQVLNIPQNVAKDPDEFIKLRGADAFEQLLLGSQGSVEFELSKIKEKYNLLIPQDKVNFVKEGVSLLARLQTPGEREVYAGVLGDMCTVSKQNILMQIEDLRKFTLRKLRKKAPQDLLKTVSGYGEKLNPDAMRNRGAAAAEEGILAAMIRNTEDIAYILDKLSATTFVTAWGGKIFSLMISLYAANAPINLTTLAPHLSQEELDKMSQILAKSMSGSIRREDIDFCIQRLGEQKYSLRETARDLGDSDLAARIENLKNKKK